MNYLAHIYLSGDNNDVKIGNFIADFIYGSHYQNYSQNIQKGILLHRQIDTFTDAHPIFRQSKKRLFPKFRHYSGVIVDMFYDHFLAKNFREYSPQDLEHFASNFYRLLESRREHLPSRVQNIIPIITKYNWLENYKNIKDLEHILRQMNKRAKFESHFHLSIESLEIHYETYEEEFKSFFIDLLAEQKKMFKSLNISLGK